MAKRSNGAGSVKRLPSGTWRGQLMDGFHDNGKRRIVSFTAPTKAELLDKIREYKNKKDILGDALTKNTPFSSWADTWYQDYATEVQPSTYANYRYTLAACKAHFVNDEIKDIKPLHINKFLDKLNQEGYSQSYVSKCRAMLIQIFDAAEANEMIVSNPARKAKKSRKNMSIEEEGGKDAFSDTELDTLEKLLPDTLIGHSIRFLLGTGLRVQELLALKSEDIAEDGSSVKVAKAIKMIDGCPALGAPKSAKGRRIVPIPQKYRKDALYLRAHGNDGFIWTSQRENKLYDVGVFRKKYYHVLKSIPGVRRLSPHCCRHTYISRLEARGVPMEQIARLVGHARITVTDGYLHTSMDTLAEAAATLDAAEPVE